MSGCNSTSPSARVGGVTTGNDMARKEKRLAFRSPSSERGVSRGCHPRSLLPETTNKQALPEEGGPPASTHGHCVEDWGGDLPIGPPAPSTAANRDTLCWRLRRAHVSMFLLTCFWPAIFVRQFLSGSFWPAFWPAFSPAGPTRGPWIFVRAFCTRGKATKTKKKQMKIQKTTNG